MKIKNIILKLWPVGIILAVTGLLFALNYTPNTWLIGWDNLLPEFYLKMNIQRSVFAVWQEYQGLGLLGGMGHATDIVHQLFILSLIKIVPTDLIRYIWTFLLLFLGSLGSYFLIKNLIFQDSQLSFVKKQILSLSGALFYLLNLATMQTFYVPFEAFIAHFAALPWLLLSTIIFFLKPSFKNGLFLTTVVLLASPQAYIPTLFVVYILSLIIIFSSLFLKDRSSFSFRSLLWTLSLIFIANSFWLLPFIYFTITNSHVALEAKINQMSTQTVFLQNMAFGDLSNVMLLKGFWFNNVDPNLSGKFNYMLLDWRNYLANPLIQIVGYSLFIIVFAGAISALKKNKKVLLSFFLLFAFAFTMLTTSTFPFSIFNNLFRMIPLFSEAFRFPFTKFAILASLSYSIFFALGIEEISNTKFFKRINFYALNAIAILLIYIFIFPMFEGHLLYDKEKLNLPKEYLQTFDYFKTQDPNSRIANFPQNTFWGWEFYNWGYGGSGFLWYGIKQPILDRAFDVWSKSSENYYWEMSHAVYSKNPQAFKNVLNKYQISFILLDKNIINPPSPKILFYSETEQLIKSIPEIKKTAVFGNIIIYKMSLKDNPQNFVFTDNKLPSVNGYNWGEFDKAYQTLGNYITKTENSDYFYPLRSLFSGKNQEDEEYNVKDKPQVIEFSQTIPKSQQNNLLTVPKISGIENIVPARIIQNKNSNNTITVSLLIKTPPIFLNYKDKSGQDKHLQLSGEEILKPLFIIRQVKDYGYYININGAKSFKIDPFVVRGDLGSTFLATNQENVFVLSNKGLNFSQSFTLKATDVQSLFNSKTVKLPAFSNDATMTIDVPKIDDSYQSLTFIPSDKTIASIKNCDNFNKGIIKTKLIKNNGENYLELSSTNSTACFSNYSSTFSHEQGYIAFVDSKNIKGRSLHFWVLSENEKFAPIDTYLGTKSPTSSFIISPQEEHGNAYSFHFENISIVNDSTINQLGDIKAYSIPYNFLTSLVISKPQVQKETAEKPSLTVYHPNESLYRVHFNSPVEKTTTIILSQSFDPGWKAYQVSHSTGIIKYIKENFPFLFGSQLSTHVLVNNWENGWVVDSSMINKDNQDIILSYTPQNLEYFGFLLTIFMTPIVLYFLSQKSKKEAGKVD